MMIDFGEDVAQCVLGTDSSAAKSIMERRGAGRFRHLHCPMLWFQERGDSGEIRIEKRKGEHNTADIGTKAVTSNHETFENVEDGVARWTTPFSVGCGNLSCNGLSGAANLANLAQFNEFALSCRETLGSAIL